MDRIEAVKKALIQALGEQMGYYSDRCCCWGAEQVMECKMGITIDALAQVAIDALENHDSPPVKDSACS